MFKYILKCLTYLFCFKSGRWLLVSASQVILVAIVFRQLEAKQFVMSPVQKRIGNELVEKAVEKFPWNRDVGRVLMIADVDAWTPFFLDAIRERVMNYSSDGSRKFDILPESFTTRVMKSLGFYTNTGRLPEEEIQRIVRTMEADTLLLVSFASSDYVEDETTASGRLSCVFYSKGKEEPFGIDATAELKKSSGFFSSIVFYFKSMPSAHKLLWGVLGVLLFPFLMAPITLTVVQAQSAKVNGFMVFIYAVVIFIYEGLIFSAPTGILQALLMCAWGVTIVWYLLKTCDLLASPRFKRHMQIQNRH